MSEAEIQARCPSAYQSWCYRRKEGLSRSGTAQRMGVVAQTVDKQVAHVEALLCRDPAKEPAIKLTDADLAANGRCGRCRMLQPHECLRPVWVHAAQRPNAGT